MNKYILIGVICGIVLASIILFPRTSSPPENKNNVASPSPSSVLPVDKTP